MVTRGHILPWHGEWFAGSGLWVLLAGLILAAVLFPPLLLPLLLALALAHLSLAMAPAAPTAMARARRGISLSHAERGPPWA